MELQSWLQIGVGLVGIVLSLGLLDLKHKLSSLNKLDHIDGIVEQLQQVVDRMQMVVTRQEVSENGFRLEIQYLKDRLSHLESRVDDLDVVSKS